jgi:hypothetical protein
MKTLKALLPLIIGIFIMLGTPTIFNTQEADARPHRNCVYDLVESDCYETSVFNCICFDVEPETK